MPSRSLRESTRRGTRAALAFVVAAAAFGALRAQELPVGGGHLHTVGPTERANFHFAAVPNSGDTTVSIVDTDTERVVATVPFGVKPKYATASPNGHWFYVAGTVVAGVMRISKIDVRTTSVIDTIDLPVNGEVGEFEISPNGRYLVAGSNQPPTFYLIDTYLNDTSVLTLVGTFTLPAGNPVAPEATFDNASQFLYVAANSGISTIDLASRQVVFVSPLPSGALYTDIENFDGIPGLVFAVSPFSLDVHSTFGPGTGQLVAFPFSHDLVSFSFVSERFIAFGTSGLPALLRLRHLNSGTTVSITATAPALQSLRFDPDRLEVWAVTPSSVFSGPTCSAFDLVNLKERASIPLPGFSGALPIAGIPAFSRDYRRFYVPDPLGSTVSVVDVESGSLVGGINVGSAPTVIVMQGDTRTREAY